MHLQAGQRALDFSLTDTTGQTHTLQDYDGTPLLFLLYRSPDCALCSLRLYQMGLAYPQLQALGLNVLAVFEANQATVLHLTHRHHPPFPLVADPDKRMFARYDVGSSRWALRGTLRLRAVWQAWRYKVSGTLTSGTIDQLPAEILIGPDGIIQIAHYGHDTGDFLSLATLKAKLTPHLLPR